MCRLFSVELSIVNFGWEEPLWQSVNPVCESRINIVKVGRKMDDPGSI